MTRREEVFDIHLPEGNLVIRFYISYMFSGPSVPMPQPSTIFKLQVGDDACHDGRQPQLVLDARAELVEIPRTAG